MPVVYEETADGAGAAVHVLVVAPDGKVDVPVVQAQRDVADSVSQIPAYNDALCLRIGRDACYVKVLACVELDSGQEQQGGRGGVFVDDGEDVFRAKRRLSLRYWLDGINASAGSSS